MAVVRSIAFAAVLAAGLYLLLLGPKEYAQRRNMHIAEGLALANVFKQRVTDYYVDFGSFPDSNEELDAPPAENFRGRSLTSIAVTSKGVIEITYDARSGIDGGVIRLIPSPHEEHLIKWDCITPSFADIQSWAPKCGYVSGVP